MDAHFLKLNIKTFFVKTSFYELIFITKLSKKCANDLWVIKFQHNCETQTCSHAIFNSFCYISNCINCIVRSRMDEDKNLSSVHAKKENKFETSCRYFTDLLKKYIDQ